MDKIDPLRITLSVRLTRALYQRYARYDTPRATLCNCTPIAKAVRYALIQSSPVAFTMVLDRGKIIEVIHRSFLRVKYRGKIPNDMRGSCDREFKITLNMTKEEKFR